MGMGGSGDARSCPCPCPAIGVALSYPSRAAGSAWSRAIPMPVPCGFSNRWDNEEGCDQRLPRGLAPCPTSACGIPGWRSRVNPSDLRRHFYQEGPLGASPLLQTLLGSTTQPCPEANTCAGQGLPTLRASRRGARLGAGGWNGTGWNGVGTLTPATGSWETAVVGISIGGWSLGGFKAASQHQPHHPCASVSPYCNCARHHLSMPLSLSIGSIQPGSTT